MGKSITPVFFYDINITMDTIESASQKKFFALQGRKLADLGPGSLEKYDDVPCHFLYTFSDGEFIEFIEDCDAV